MLCGECDSVCVVFVLWESILYACKKNRRVFDSVSCVCVCVGTTFLSMLGQFHVLMAFPETQCECCAVSVIVCVCVCVCVFAENYCV